MGRKCILVKLVNRPKPPSERSKKWQSISIEISKSQQYTPSFRADGCMPSRRPPRLALECLRKYAQSSRTQLEGSIENVGVPQLQGKGGCKAVLNSATRTYEVGLLPLPVHAVLCADRAQTRWVVLCMVKVTLLGNGTACALLPRNESALLLPLLLPQVTMEPGTVAWIAGRDGSYDCLVYCWRPGSDELQDRINADPQLLDKYGTVAVMHNSLMSAALCWGSNRQSTVTDYQGHPCSTMETSGSCGIVGGYDMESLIKVRWTDCGSSQHGEHCWTGWLTATVPHCDSVPHRAV